MGANGTFFDDVVGATYEFLGPASDRFCARQVQSHLGKSPDQFQKRDLENLIIWFCLAMGTLSEDTDLVKQYEAKLKSLTNHKK